MAPGRDEIWQYPIWQYLAASRNPDDEPAPDDGSRSLDVSTVAGSAGHAGAGSGPGGGEPAVGRIAIHGVRQLPGQPGQQLVAGEARLAFELGQDIGSDHLFQIRRRNILIGTLAHPGIGLLALAGLFEAIDQLAQNRGYGHTTPRSDPSLSILAETPPMEELVTRVEKVRSA